MIMHFVCMGNTYRSRLAEAYFNSLNISGWQATSSGMRAERDLNGDITSYAKRILEREGLLQYTATTWTQTTKELVEESDHVVFVHPNVYELCKKTYNPTLKSFDVWDIDDISDNVRSDILTEHSEKTYALLKTHINDMGLK